MLKKKLYVSLSGGLGNQLFQYFSAYSMAKEQNKDLYLNLSHYIKNKNHGGFRLDKFCIGCFKYKGHDNIIKNIIKKIIIRFPVTSLFFRGYFHESYTDKVFLQDEYEMLGYWQDSSYFDAIYDEIKKAIVPKHISEEVYLLSIEMSKCNSVSVHFRRGDYLDKVALKNHGVCSVDFYKKAIEKIEQMVEDPVYYIFTNDCNWVSNELHHIFRKESKVVFSPGLSQEEDLWLMSKSKHHIIANSSFSWWGSYLARASGQIVICPDPWYSTPQRSSSDPSLKKWIKINK